MPTKTKNCSRSCTRRSARPCTTGTAWTATQIATFLNEASTPNEKGTATKRLNAYVAQRVSEGADASRVEANVRSLSRRLGRG